MTAHPMRARTTGLTSRRSERDMLDRLAGAVRASQGRALVLRGDPGMGKTVLLDHLAGQASSAGCRVAHAVGVQSEMELAFAGQGTIMVSSSGTTGRGSPRRCWSPRSPRTCCRRPTTRTGCRKACSTGTPPPPPPTPPAWMKGFVDNYYSIDTLRGTLVSEQAWQASWNQALAASAIAVVACIGTWITDFRADLPKIDVPVLVLHGDADQVLPLDKTAKRLPGLINDVQLTVIEGGPHAIPWTHASQVNTALLDFFGR